ncbi:hypothetical protein Dimus_020550, partial [Dionaea muscipula]
TRQREGRWRAAPAAMISGPKEAATCEAGDSEPEPSEQRRAEVRLDEDLRRSTVMKSDGTGQICCRIA